jgi:imidazoleglycerol-phosphate dehydratase
VCKHHVPFLDHMLELFAKHGNFFLTVEAKGDTHIDDHHLVEDIGLTLGEALGEALGEKRGIPLRAGLENRNRRVGSAGRALTPMDETVSYVALDLSGRPAFDFKVKFQVQNKAPFVLNCWKIFFKRWPCRRR